MNREAALGEGAGVAVMLLFSGMLVVSRFGATSDLTVYDMAGLRFGVAGMCTLPIILRTRWPRLELWKVMIIAATSGSPFALFLFGGMSYAPVAHGGIVTNGAMPVIAAGIGWVVFGARLGGWRVIGIVMIVGGVLATGWDALVNGMPGQWRGHLLFLGAAACNATFLTTVRGWGITALQSLVIVNGVNLALYVPLWL